LDSDGEKMIFVIEENHPPVPKQVFRLPAPPSDCGSAFQSDSSLTVSEYTFDPNVRSQTFDDYSAHSHIIDSDHEGDEADTIHDNDEDDVLRSVNNVTVDKTTTSIGSDQNSKGSTAIETADFSDDLEGQGYPRSTFRQGKFAGNNNNSKNHPKKRVTLVEPTKSWTVEKEENYFRIQEKVRRTKRREVCCRKAVFVLFFLSFLAIVIGGGLSTMVYFDIIDLDNLNLTGLLKEKPPIITNSDLSAFDESNDLVEDLYGIPLTTSPLSLDTEEPTPSPTSLPSRFVPTASPTVSVEGTFITDTLSGQFRIELPQNDPSAPPSRAVAWMVEELKYVSKGHSDYHYDNMGKFGQRFALLVTQYSLLGEDMAMEQPPFFLDEQIGVDECEWEGVFCDEYGRVIGVDFSDLDLTGNIPSEIRYLFKLETLDLSHNRIIGTIPKEVYDLRNLNKLYLYQNKLTGTISTWIGQLYSLEYLHLSQNSLTGSIPEQMRSYSDSVQNPLIYLNLYDNRLIGTIPNNLNLGNLFYFDIGRNHISGSIPDDIGTDFGELKYLHIDHNQLTSSIPDTIPLMANGRMISFLANHNRLSGVVPDNWIMFNKLVQYTFQENYFDYLGPENCNMNVFSGGQCVEFKADCDICSCNDNFCNAMCSRNNLL